MQMLKFCNESQIDLEKRREKERKTQWVEKCEHTNIIVHNRQTTKKA